MQFIEWPCPWFCILFKLCQCWFPLYLLLRDGIPDIRGICDKNLFITCTSLSAPIHGSVSCSNSANVGSRCTYSCSTGYRRSGGIVTRICSRSLNSGTWSGSAPACARISCGALSGPSNGQVSCSDSSYYNSLCGISCRDGYTLQGSSSRLCGVSGRWSGSNPSCAVIRCNSLSAPIHGAVSCSNSANVGSHCTYSCSTGYRTSRSVQWSSQLL
ncbi:E-selectin-like [Strongylocentrotus purpuratus]|uniref:Sushi domain-containing protein n=1 Tax=Strongylocentrotus purpuratus TaxID=7668 RepID=A0A7M7P6R0_STRPU|nr:E-selectin-like [Strongylocentrotus purpuratus]